MVLDTLSEAEKYTSEICQDKEDKVAVFVTHIKHKREYGMVPQEEVLAAVYETPVLVSTKVAVL